MWANEEGTRKGSAKNSGCDLMSLLLSDSYKESWPVCRPVAGLACVTGNGGVRSRDEKPNDKGSHHRTQGKAKTDKANDCEPSREASLFGATETMAETVVLSRM